MQRPATIRRRHINGWLCLITVLLLVVVLAVGGRGHPGGHTLSLAGITLPAGRFILLYGAAWFLMMVLMFVFPKGLSKRRALLGILGVSVLVRLVLVPHEPSDDVNRYLWEGHLVTKGLNPYLTPPNDPSLKEMAKTFPGHADINHPDIPAAYPPLMLILFSIISHIALTALPVKLLMAAVDIGAIVFLILILGNRKLDARWALLYAVNPMVLYSFSGQGHFDAVQNFLLLSAVWLSDRRKWGLMFVAAGMAIQVKYVAVLAIPFLVTRDNYRFAPLVLLPVVLPFLPFAGSGIKPLFSGIVTFGESFAFNGMIHGVFRWITGGISPATRMCNLLFGSAMLLILVRYNRIVRRQATIDPIAGITAAFAALLLFTPTVHIWYLTWILPFAVIRTLRSWILLSLTAAFYFVATGMMHHTGEWRLPVWAQVLEWVPFAIVFTHEVRLAIRRRQSSMPYPHVETVSVVIPVKNEAASINRCIKGAFSDTAVSEVIVVDGGSQDQTRSLAQAAGARVIGFNTPPEKGGGRGGQIAAGIAASTGDVVAVMHADTTCDKPVFTPLLEVLNRNPDVVGGALGTVFDDGSFKMRCIEFLNDVRAALFGISFGDQLQFFRREPVTKEKLFPAIPLMEDVEFSYRLPFAGRGVYLFGETVVSSRRWKRGGMGNFIIVVRFFFRYVIERLVRTPDVAGMYYRYYNPSKNSSPIVKRL